MCACPSERLAIPLEHKPKQSKLFMFHEGSGVLKSALFGMGLETHQSNCPLLSHESGMFVTFKSSQKVKGVLITFMNISVMNSLDQTTTVLEARHRHFAQSDRATFVTGFHENPTCLHRTDLHTQKPGDASWYFVSLLEHELSPMH